MSRSGVVIIGTILFLGIFSTSGQEPVDPSKVKVLLIGNSNYKNLERCATSTNNVAILSAAFQRLGFAITKAPPDADINTLSASVKDFSRRVKPGDIAIVYYSGYAGQQSNDNYLIPSDFPASQADLDSQAYSLRRIEADLEQAGARLFVLEAARKLDALASLFTTEGLTILTSSGNTLIALPAIQSSFAPSAGNRTTDIFTEALADKLTEPGLTAEQLFANVRDSVTAATKGAQVPVIGSGMSKVLLTGAATARPGEVRSNKLDKQEYAWIPRGPFQMGCVRNDNQCQADEKPRHLVTMGKGFWIGQNEVTVETYRAYVNSDKKNRKMPPAPQINNGWKNETHPIVNVSWDEANTFCKASGGWLPTEAEWEYAARGGVDGLRYVWGEALSREKANFSGTGLKDIWVDTSPVRKFDTNEWKLYDMSGNAWEWCNDWYEAGYYARSPDTDPQGPEKGTDHVKRGGGFNSAENELRLSVRRHFNKHDNNTGFRCVVPDLPK